MSGLAATARAYGYAGIICAGPMILGIVLLLGIMFLCNQTGGTRFERELLICMVTYSLLASLTVTSFLSMVVTRFLADMLYEEKLEAILPSFSGFYWNYVNSRRNSVRNIFNLFRCGTCG